MRPDVFLLSDIGPVTILILVGCVVGGPGAPPPYVAPPYGAPPAYGQPYGAPPPPAQQSAPPYGGPPPRGRKKALICACNYA
jgi:hypothetical protein